MRKEIIYSLSGLYRDDFRVTGYRFGSGEKSCCIIGALRGDEIRQLYMSSKLVKIFKALEEKGAVADGREILVIPCVNNYGINLNRRFWCLDNTDINRIFPGNENGDTIERIAAGVFNEVKDYRYCVELESRYIPGSIVPHVQIIDDGADVSLAESFGLDYTVLRNPSSLDKTTLNYNLRKSGVSSFSICTEGNTQLDEFSANEGVTAVLRFLSKTGIISCDCPEGAAGTTVNDEELINVRSSCAGFFLPVRKPGEKAAKGDVLAQICHPYEGEVVGEITSPVDGAVFFARKNSLIAEGELAFRIVRG